MKRIFNYRPTVVFCLLLIVSILISWATAISPWFAFLFVVPIGCAIGIAFYRKKWTALCYLLAIVVGFGGYLNITLFNKNVSENTVIEARVYQVLEDDEGTYGLIVGNVRTEGGVGLGGKTYVYVDDDNVYNVGDKISVYGRLKSTNILSRNNVNSYNYRYNIKYSFDPYGETVINHGMKYLSEIIRLTSKRNLKDNLPRDVASVSYAVLFGDKTLIEDNVSAAFNGSGVAHLLAVSGLHVGFMILVIYFLLGLMHIKRWWRFGVVAVILAFYSYICNFSPSVMRASIMALVVLFADNTGREKDRLSAIALSAILILAFRPLYIFDMGFLLSYGAVLGILLLSRPLEQIFGKSRVGRVIARVVTVTVCAQIGVLPLTIDMGELPTYSLLSNIITVPLFGVAYVVLFLINLLVLILPFMRFCFILVEGLMGGVMTIIQFIANLPGATIRVLSIGVVATTLFYLLIVFISRFAMLSRYTKVIVCSVLAILCVTLAGVYNIENKSRSNSLELIQSYSLSALVSTESGSRVLVGLPRSELEESLLCDYLRSNKIRLDAVIVLPYEVTSTKYCDDLAQFVKGDVLVLQGSDMETALGTTRLRWLSVEGNSNFEMPGYAFEYIANEDGLGVWIRVADKEILYITSDIDEVDVELIDALGVHPDIMIVQKMTSIISRSFVLPDDIFVEKSGNSYYKLDYGAQLMIEL